MEIGELKKDFAFWLLLAVFLIYLISMAGLIIVGSYKMQQTGVVLGLIWLLTTVLLPSFAGFFVYQNWKPFWISIVCMIISGFVVIIVDSSYTIINKCSHQLAGCDLNMFIPISTITMILIAISTMIIIIKDWVAKTRQTREQKSQEQKLTEL
jgi:hypothetical protein